MDPLIELAQHHSNPVVLIILAFLVAERLWQLWSKHSTAEGERRLADRRQSSSEDDAIRDAYRKLINDLRVEVTRISDEHNECQDRVSVLELDLRHVRHGLELALDYAASLRARLYQAGINNLPEVPSLPLR